MTIHWLRQFFTDIRDLLHQMVANQITAIRIQTRIEANTSNASIQLAKLVKLLTPPAPVRFEIRLSAVPTGASTGDTTSDFLGDLFMSDKNKVTDSASSHPGGVLKATVDFQLHDDGTATATLTPIDSKDEVTVMPDGASSPAWVSSDPAVTVNSAADGMSAAVAPNITPGQTLPVGVVITVTSTLADGTVVSGSSSPIDVVAGKAAGFQIALQ